MTVPEPAVDPGYLYPAAFEVVDPADLAGPGVLADLVVRIDPADPVDPGMLALVWNPVVH